MGRDAGWIELTLSDKVAITVDQAESVIDNLKNSFVTSGTANIELDIGMVRFESGQKFLDFIYDKGLGLSDFGQGVINQK